MSVSEDLAMRFRIERVLLLNALAYMGLGYAVFAYGLYATHQGGTVDLAL